MDLQKHCYPSKADFVALTCRTVYIIGDPLLSIVSHYRRGWCRSQLKKLRAPRDALDCESIDHYIQLVNSKQSDMFGITDHFRSWIRCKPFVTSLQNIVQNPTPLSDFIGVDVMDQRNTYWHSNISVALQ